MHPDVSAKFFDWSRTFEGYTNWMYLDVKGLVTIGVGNLIDPVAQALRLPFVRHDGTPASRGDIAAEWCAVKDDRSLARKGARAARAVTALRLPEAAVRTLVAERLAANEAHLSRSYFPDFGTWPADAQLATLSMAWALGSGFPRSWPLLRGALARRDFASAADNCLIRETGNPGVRPRNEANQMLFRSAAQEQPCLSQ